MSYSFLLTKAVFAEPFQLGVAMQGSGGLWLHIDLSLKAARRSNPAALGSRQSRRLIGMQPEITDGDI
jgi:hypothetical protein